MPNWQRAIWLAIAMAAIPWACFQWIEQPMIRFGTRLANRGQLKKVLAPAA